LYGFILAIGRCSSLFCKNKEGTWRSVIFTNGAIFGLLGFIILIAPTPDRNSNSSSSYKGGVYSHFGFSPTTQAISEPSTASQSSNAYPEQTDTPTPTVDHHNERLAVTNYWIPVIVKITVIQLELYVAAEEVKNGDTVSASQSLTQGIQFAEAAKSAAAENDSLPEALRNDSTAENQSASTSLFAAANEFEKALQSEKDYLDSNKPSDMANAKDHGSQGREYLDDAQHEARVFYRDNLGGNPMELLDTEQVHDIALKVIRAETATIGHE
jgi:hypothetical protein